MAEKEYPRIENDERRIGTFKIHMNRWFSFTITITDHELHIFGDNDAIEVLPQATNHIVVRRLLRMGLNK